MSRIPRPLRLPLLVVLPVLVLVVLGVVLLRGGGDDPREVARQAFGADEPIRSGRTNLLVSIDTPGVQGVQGPVSARLRGPFASRGRGAPAFDFDIDATVSGQRIALGAVSTGSAGFVEFQGQAFSLSRELYAQLQAGRQADSVTAGRSATPSLRSLGVDPLRWLTDPQTVGTEEEGGVDAVHVRSRIDVQKLIADLDRLVQRTAALRSRAQGGQQAQGLSAPQRIALARAIRGATLDFWAGEDDDLLRRVVVRLDLDGTVLGGSGAGTATVDFRVAELNEPQRVSTPPNALPLDRLQQLLQQAGVGGAGAAGSGGGGSGSGSSSAAGSGSSGSGGGAGSAASTYQQCVERAGSDVDALRRCVR